MLQKVILEQFDEKFKNPTYKEMVDLTGIEQTRLFRIKNGVTMRVDELEAFINCLSEEGGPLQLFLECYRYLDVSSIHEIEREIKRKIILAKLMRGA